MKQYVYVGTYTETKSRGIYGFCLDENGDMSAPRLLAKEVSPTFLCVDRSAERLYCAGEPHGNAPVMISAYAIDHETGDLSLINRVEASCQGICHITLDPQEKFLLTASYADATIQAYRLGENGSVGEKTAYIHREGSGPNTARQSSAHVHSNWFTPDGKWMITCDLGTDQLVFYRLDYTDGTLTEVPEKTIHVPGGYGPRHLTFHPNGKWIYVAAEIVDHVLVYSRDAERGLTLLQDVTATERESTSNTAAAVRVSSDGRHLYISNRGEDTLTHYLIGEDGRLSCGERISSHGRTPRDFAPDLTERYVLCGNQDSDTLVVYKRNTVNGELTYHQMTDAIGMPACIVCTKCSNVAE